MIALVRTLAIPCRYVSGYLFHRAEDHDRSADDATHAWVEALLPGLGWVGFDPTNNLVAGERHIRTAVGRDYADVPPTRGVYKGRAESALEVGVKVAPTEAPIPDEEVLPVPAGSGAPAEGGEEDQQQQQQ
jgi:transglutaminase-like putative cysteine protease